MITFLISLGTATIAGILVSVLYKKNRGPKQKKLRTY